MVGGSRRGALPREERRVKQRNREAGRRAVELEDDEFIRALLDYGPGGIERALWTLRLPEASKGKAVEPRGPLHKARKAKVSVGRSGRIEGLGYGLRILQDAPQGSLIVTYFGEYHLGDLDDWVRRDEDRRTSMERDVKRYWMQCPAVDGLPEFGIDAWRCGNAARWINHSTADANLELRALDETTLPSQESRDAFEDEDTEDGLPSLPLLGLYAMRDLTKGEELFWDYGNSAHHGPLDRPRKSAPATGGVKWIGRDGALDAGADFGELLRMVEDDTPFAGLWHSRIKIEHPVVNSSRHSLRTVQQDVLMLQGEHRDAESDEDED